jgi:dethiobiotin synthetase
MNPAVARGAHGPGIFIAGTDTGVGKTTVAVGLVRLALRAGLAPIPFKPVETGCAPEPEDAHRLWDAARPPATLAEVCPFPLPLPAAPAAAAAERGLHLDVAELAHRGLALATRGRFLLVEGAGGLLAPYDDTTTNADLAAHLSLPVLVVARTALGTINHVALTLAELARRSLPLAGLVLVRTTADVGPHETTNARLIESLTGARSLGPVPFLTPVALASPNAVADAVLAALSPGVVDQLLAGSPR